MSRSKRQPWVKDYQPLVKKAQKRRYRRVVRQEVKRWIYKYWEHTDERYCGFCECWEVGSCFYMFQPEEPAFPAPHKFNDSYDVCDWRYYDDSPACRRK